MIRLAIAIFVVMVSAAPSSGQEWAKKLFTDFKHDFGTVATASKVDHTFEMVNPFKETIHIASVRASCGCSTPTITKKSLKTWEKGGINVRFNTRTFTGKKGATITVVIDQPFYAEVQLRVDGYIRTDVVFNPGVVSFDAIDQGVPVTKEVSVNYAGRADWQIMDIQSANTNFEVELNELRRNAGRVDYKLLVRAKESMPAGFFNDQLVLVTNDQRATQVPLRVEGKVVPGLTVSPASLFLGVVKPGEQVKKTLIVRGKRPFKITNVTCADGDCFQFKSNDDSKKTHIIPVVFTASEPGKIAQQIKIETDLPGKTIAACVATATVEDQ